MFTRIVLAFFGLVLLLAGITAIGSAAWGYSVLGTDGVMRLDLGTITPDPTARATIIDVDRYDVEVPYIGGFGTSSLEAAGLEIGDPTDVLFLGAAPTTDVDAYLRGTAYSVALRDGDGWTTRQVPGNVATANPGAQQFWLADATGRQPAIAIPDQRPLTLVVMHPAGLPSGPFALTIDFVVPEARAWIIGLAVGGALLVISGIVLIVLAFRVRRGRHAGRHEAEAVAVSDAVDA